MSNKFSTAREEIKTILEAVPGLAGVAIFVERAGEDIDEAVETALNTKGLAVIILSSAAGVADQIRQGAAVLRVTTPVCVLENVVRNMADADTAADLPAGTKVSSEDAIQLIIRGLLGKTVGDGCATLSKDVFARGGDEAGLVETYIGIDAPIVLKGL